MAHFLEVCTDRNKDWFPDLIKNYQSYFLWTLLRDQNGQVVAFSSIQCHDFPEYTARIGTRTFIVPQFRNKKGTKEKRKSTPIFQMLLHQYNYLKNNTKKSNCFSSVEYNRTAGLRLCEEKFNNIGIPAKLLKHRYKMFDNRNHPSGYQNVLLFPITNQTFDLEKEN